MSSRTKLIEKDILDYAHSPNHISAYSGDLFVEMKRKYDIQPFTVLGYCRKLSLQGKLTRGYVKDPHKTVYFTITDLEQEKFEAGSRRFV